MVINMWLLRYFVSLIVTFFAFFSWHFIFGKNTDFLSFFYTTHLAFDGLLLGGILIRTFISVFEINSKMEKVAVED